MRKIRMLLAASIVAVPLAAVTAGPAAACPTDACSRLDCWANNPVIVTDDAIFFSQEPVVECGWH